MLQRKVLERKYIRRRRDEREKEASFWRWKICGPRRSKTSPVNENN